MEQTEDIRGVRNTLSMSEAATDLEESWPEDKAETEQRFRSSAQEFLTLTYDIVNGDIQRQEARLMNLRRKRQEMIVHAERLGLKLPTPTY